MSKTGAPIRILLVEDNDGDIELTRIGLEEGRVDSELNVAKSGEEALSYLRREGRFAGAIQPDLVLLDLNLPGTNGQEVLRQIKSDGSLRRIPVVVVSSSNSSADIAQAYGLHANSYVVKPVDLQNLIDTIKRMTDYWFSVVKLPTRVSTART